MDKATRNGNNFLTDDPQWAIDFAPNGTWLVGYGLMDYSAYHCTGTLLKVNETLTRKRYAE
jgi:hypothetical protein